MPTGLFQNFDLPTIVGSLLPLWEAFHWWIIVFFAFVLAPRVIGLINHALSPTKPAPGVTPPAGDPKRGRG